MRHYPACLAAVLVTALIVCVMPAQAFAVDPVTPGAIEGRAGVGQRGGATYSIPLLLPQGIAGLQPQLSLSYGSQVGAGYVGEGWSLGGLGAITLCAAVKALDAEYRSIALTTSDHLCFNGQRLIKNDLAPDNNGAGVYRSEINDFSMIEASAGDEEGLPAGLPYAWSSVTQFKVKTKDGKTLTFGGTVNSRQLSRKFETGSVQTFGIAWYLSKVSDRFGNYYTVSYLQDPVDGELVPAEINYTGNEAGAVSPRYRVVFTYRAGQNSYSYLGGAPVFGSQLIDKIAVNQGGTLVREYRLGYSANVTASTYLLTSLQECGNGSNGISCKSPTTFGWTARSVYAVCYGGAIKTSLGALSTQATGDSYVMDANGDGRSDIVMLNRQEGNGLTVTTALSQIPVPDSASQSCKPLPGGAFSVAQSSALSEGVNLVAATVHAEDVNGDGKQDLIFVRSGFEVGVALSGAGGSFTWVPSSGSPTLTLGRQFAGDIDGDNIVDIFSARMTAANGAGSEHVVIDARYGNGDGTFGSPVQWTVGALPYITGDFSIGDFNGDGRQDIAAYYTDDLTSSKKAFILHASGSSVDRTSIIWGAIPDFGLNIGLDAQAIMVMGKNRDGVADFVSVTANNYGAFDARTWLSRGNLAAAQAISESATSSTLIGYGLGQTTLLADLTGDGAPELIHAAILENSSAGNKRQLKVYPNYNSSSRGFYAGATQFVMRSEDGLGLPATSSFAIKTGDFNGDGRADIVAVGSTPTDVEAYTAVTDGQYPDLMTTVTDGNGAVITFEYGSTANSSVHTARAAASGQVAVTAPLYVVTKLTQDQGPQGSTSTHYRYEGAAADLNGRNFLGYQKVITTDALGTETETTYAQGHPFTGMVTSSRSVLNGTLLSELVNELNSLSFTWPEVRPAGNPGKSIVFPYVYRSTVKSYEYNSHLLISQAVTTRAYDLNGNLTSEATDITGGGRLYRRESALEYYDADTSFAKWRLDDLKIHTVRNINYDGLTQSTAVLSDITRATSYENYDVSTGFRKRQIREGGVAEAYLRQQIDYVPDIFGHVQGVKVRHTGQEGDADPDTRISTNIYDSTGRFVQVATNALNQSTTQGIVESAGTTVKTITDVNGLISTQNFDAFGRIVLETRPDSTTTATDYLACDSTCLTGEKYYIRSMSTGAAPVRVYYDRVGHPRRRVSMLLGGLESNVATEYDALGRVSRVSQPYATGVASTEIRWTTTEYDVAGRAWRVTQPGGRISKTVFDGAVTTSTNARQVTRQEERNALGKVIAVTDAKGGVLQYRYDAFDNLIGVTDAALNQTTLTLDSLGNKKQHVDPDLGTWTYSYNHFGEQTTQTDAEGNLTTFTYDKLGRLTDKSNPDLNSHWVYDTSPVGKGKGKLYKAWAENGYERVYSYDALGLVTQVTVTPATGAAAYVQSMAYDPTIKSRLVTYTYPNGGGYKNIYDATTGLLSKVRNLTDTASYWEAVSMDAAGRITQEKLGSQLFTKRSYDPDTTLPATVQTGALLGTGVFSASIQNDAYYFDDVGNLKLRLEAVNNLAESFDYDELDRLTEASQLNGTATTMQYDAIGNIAYKSDIGTYSYTGCGGAHRVCGTTGTLSPTFVYDLNGNRTQTKNGTVVTSAITWTDFNKPHLIQQDGNIEEFVYDSEYERVKRISTRLVNGSPQSSTLVTLNPRLDLGGTYEVETRSDNSVVNTWHIYAGGKPVGAVEEVGGQSTVRYFHTDHLGSVRVVTGSTGQALEGLSYDAWGRRRGLNGTPQASYNLLWQSDLASPPTTGNPNAVGLTMPPLVSDNLITWLSSGKLSFDVGTRRKASPSVAGQYLAAAGSNVRLRFTFQTSVANARNRYFNAGLVNTGSGDYFRRFTVLVRGSDLYAQRCDPACLDFPLGTVTDATLYQVELTSSGRTAALKVYPQGTDPASGYVYSDLIDWTTDGNGNLSKQFWAGASGKPKWLMAGALLPIKMKPAAILVDDLDLSGITPTNSIVASTTRHGFTGHEMLDAEGLVHMNGRVYDPLLGRFLSADPNVFFPENAQDFNRYSYVHNNPLSLIDLSGYKSSSELVNFSGGSVTSVCVEGSDSCSLFSTKISDNKVIDRGTFFVNRSALQGSVTNGANVLGGASYLMQALASWYGEQEIPGNCALNDCEAAALRALLPCSGGLDCVWGGATRADFLAADAILRKYFSKHIPQRPSFYGVGDIDGSAYTNWLDMIVVDSKMFGGKNTSVVNVIGFLQTLLHENLHVQESVGERLYMNMFPMGTPFFGYIHIKLDEKAWNLIDAVGYEKLDSDFTALRATYGQN